MQSHRGRHQKYARRFFGRVTVMHHDMRHSGREVSVSREELKRIAFDSVVYWRLYENWVDAGFLKGLTPSIDRIDNSRGYHRDNIQFLTHSENVQKGRRENPGNRAHSVFAERGGVEGYSFESLNQCARYLKVHPGTVWNAAQTGLPIKGWFVEYEKLEAQTAE